MKGIYLTGEGTAEAEEMKFSRRYIEFKDGYHPNDPGAILTHQDHKFPPVAFIWQGRSNMEGANPSLTELANFCKKTEIARQHNRKVGISRRWVRKVIAGFILFFKLLVLFYLAAFLGLMLAVFG